MSPSGSRRKGVSRKKAVPRKLAKKCARKVAKRRIGHIYDRENEPQDGIPRGWITPRGEFLRTRKHWVAISHQFGESRLEDPEVGERCAHVAYSQGWISVGHGGVLNAIAHERVWKSVDHPGVETLRSAMEGVLPQVFRVERQMGEIDSTTGRHEDFEVGEFDLEFFMRRGKLRRM